MTSQQEPEAALPALIDSGGALEQALVGLQGSLAVDTEFHAEHRYYPRLMLIQVRDQLGTELLIDPRAIPDLEPLGQALQGRRVLMHALSQDVAILERATGWQPDADQLVDVQLLAGFCGLGYPRSLAEVLDRVLQVRSPNSTSMSNWGRRPLKPSQLRYAMADVRWLHALADALHERIPPDLRVLARAATEELVRAALEPADPSKLWLKIPGAAVLDGAGRSALRRMCSWRETVARQRNVPRWQIAHDGVLLDLARRQPERQGQFADNRKFPKKLSRDYGAVVLDMLSQGRSDPAPPPPVALRDEVALTATMLTAWAQRTELDLGISERLLMPQQLRQALALYCHDRRWPYPLTGWREQAFGAAARQLLNGEIALTAPAPVPSIPAP